MRKRTMKRLCFLLTFAAITTIIRAGVVSEQEALMKAKNFMPEKTFEQPQNANRAPMRGGGQTTAPAYYIFNADENDGFVIVSADDRTNSIIGFSETGHIDESNIPTNMQAWLNSYEEVISILRSDPTIQNTPDTTINRINIEPLLQSKWGQDSPYNLLCPTYHGKPCLTGCVATAMAQIMYYHKWPANESTTIPSYTLTDGSNSSNSLILEELPPIIFDWDKMSTQTLDENKTAIAELMQYCSQSVNTAYSPTESAASSENVVIALKDYFDYHKGLKFITRSNYSYNDWENIIYNELNAKRPVFYDGSNVEDGGHAWVCDGYKDGYFHMNWGWDGAYNGYFLLSLLSTDNYNQARYYSYRYQSAIIDIRPSTETSVHVGTEFNHDGYHYVITNENSVTISNIEGNIYSGKEGTLYLPDSIKYDGKTYCVTSLGQINGISDFKYTNLILPTTLKKIESNASFITVTTITIPDKVESIELGAFTNSKIEYIETNNNARFKTIDGVLFSSDGKELISYPRSKKGNKYSVPEGVTHICDKAFYYNENLDSVHLPTSIDNIGSFAFYNSKLKYINLNDSIYEIGRNAFSNCLLTEIDIPTNLEFLEIEAFSGCPLKKITSRSTLPATADDHPFDIHTYSNATLVVPVGSLEVYKNEKNFWQHFVNIEEQDIDYDKELEKNRMYSYEDNGITISLKRTRNFDDRLVIPDYLMIDGQKKYVSEIINFNTVNAQSLILPESLEFLNGNFGNMPNLKYVYISKNISNISMSFNNTPKLNLINIDPDNKSFCIEDGILFSKDKKRLVIMPEGVGYTNYVIPEGVEDINHSFYSNETIESITIPSSVKKMSQAFDGCINLKEITFANGLTRIEGFRGCTSLEEITIPASVDVIGSGAFLGCTNLRTIIIKQTNPCFLNDLGVDVYLGENGNDCFDDIVYENAVLVVPLGCSNIYKTSDNWSKFKHIEERDLTDCNTNRLRTTIDGITYSCDLQKQEATIIRSENQNIPKDFTLPSSILVDGVCCKIMEIGPYAFANIAREINQLTIPEGIHTIDKHAFDGCVGLMKLQLPTTLREICGCAFWDCYSLSELVIPEGVKTIGAGAFQDCNSLEYLYLPSTIEYIETSAFARCSSLIAVTIHNSNPNSIPGDVFSKLEKQREWTDKATLYVPKGTKNTYLSKNGWNKFSVIEEGELIKATIDGMTYTCIPSKHAILTEGNKNISNITIPSQISVNGIDYMVTSIGSYAFGNSDSLKNINLPSSLVSIKDYAFSGCNIDTLIIPEGVVSIGVSSFYSCNRLRTVVLPSTIKMIDQYAFNYCNLSSVIVRMDKPCEISENVFDISSMATLYVPVGATDLYKNAVGWNKFQNILEGELKEVTIDGMTYAYATESKVATLIKGDPYLTEINIPAYLSVDGVDIAVTTIGRSAFFHNNSITKLTVSEGIKSIEASAFRYCHSLKQVNLPSSLTTIEDYAFSGCNIDTLIIPEGVITIGASSFYYCYGLRTVVLPSSLTTIEGDAFAGCTGLSSVIVRMNNPFAINERVFGVYASSATLYVPVGTTELYKNAVGWNKFQNILEGELKEVTIDGMTYVYVTGSKIATLIKGESNSSELNIPSFFSVDGVDIAVTTIGRSAFYDNISITKLTVSEGIKNIEASAFGCCYSLEKVDLPSSLTTIEDYAFSGCNIDTLIIPEGVISIRGGAFSGCSGLTSIVVEEGNTIYDSRNGCNAIIETASNKLVAGCVNTVIPNSVTSIGSSAFSHCSGLTSITIPESVTTIGASSFHGCNGLRTVVLPSTIKMIDQYAFNYCNLSSVIVRMDKPCEISENVFDISSMATLYVPVGATDLYKNAVGWNKFQNILEGELKEVTIDGMTYAYATESKVATLIKGDPYLTEINIPAYLSVDGVDIAVTTIGRSAFYNNNSITKLSVAEGIKNIEASAFGCCFSLEKVDLPSSLTTIEDAAFVSCIGLSSVIVRMYNPFAINERVFGVYASSATLYVPVGTTELYKNAVGWNKFQNILEGELKEVTIDGMTYVYVTGSKIATLIKGESNSSELNIPSSISIDGIDIDVTTIGRDAFFNNNSITKLTVSEGIKIIEASAFGCCYSLEKVDLPSSLTTIDDCAFDRCGIIDTLIIPEGVERIGVFSFYGCDMLRTVVLPSTIKMIDECAFNDCKLSSVIVRINNPFEIIDNVFAPISPNAVLCVPEGTASKYQETAGWNTFAIIAEPVVIKANDYIIQYGEELPDFSYTSYGVGLSGTPQITCAATTHSPVGTYPIVISKGSVTNYNDMYINGTLTITKAPLTITALNDTIRRHEVIPEFSFVYSGFKNNEDDNVLDIKPSLSCNAASDSGLGDYEIIVSGAEAKNYDITYINGKLTIKAGIFIIKYLIDNELFQTDSISYGTTIQPPMWSERVGYTFSGWSEIPQTMPANDMEVIGTFVVNKYLLQVLIDGEEVYSDSIAFGTKLADYAALITEQGIDLSQWEFYDQVETVTMPAHDVIINAVRDGIMPVMIDKENTVIYDLTGKRVEADDINALPDGIYIINGRKYQIRR